MRTYGRHTCFFCKKQISNNGLAFTNHMRMHVRSGEAVEYWDESLQYRTFTAKTKAAKGQP